MKCWGIVSFFLLGLALTQPVCGAANWWSANYQYRISLTVKESRGIARKKLPVSITGEVLMRESGKRDIDVRSLRLIDINGREIPLQVDEKDDTGIYQSAPNNRLDPDDEILFQVDMPAGATLNCHVYFGMGTPKGEGYDTGDVACKEVVLSGSVPSHILLSNSLLQVGIQGNDEKVANGSYKSCITFLMNGKKMLVPYNPSLFWGPTQVMAPWDALPAIIARGPVRTTVMLKSGKVDGEFKPQGGGWSVASLTKGSVTGSIYRYYSLYNGIPYLECREVFRPEKASPVFCSSYGFSLITAPVSPLKRGDVLYVPLDEKNIAAVKVGDKSYYDTKYPASGWIGIGSTAEKNGLTLFFDHEKAANAFASLIRPHYRANLGGNDGWMTSDIVISYENKDMDKAKAVCNRFGLYVLTGEGGEDIRDLYTGIWGSPPEIEWGSCEQQTGGNR